MQLSQEIIDDVLREYRRTRSPFRTANLTGLEVSVVWEILETNVEKLTSYLERNSGLGRSEMEPFIVGRRKVNSRCWDNLDPPIAEARVNYERGTHDMMTGRDGGWLILYSVPLKRVKPRPNYFKPEAF